MLVAPLDWGLGHATRCIPLVRVLLMKGCQVLIAANGAQKVLLQEEFPELGFIDLDGYNIRYSRKWLLAGLLLQLFKIRLAIKKEKAALPGIIAKHGIDWVISDNRYGLYSSQTPSTIITHQLSVMPPAGFSWAKGFLRKVIYGYINQFSNCWVPDLPDISRGLSGELGHPEIKPTIATWYTGWLSRFTNTNELPSRYKCIIVLSGPEPQRTMLEEIIVKQLIGTKDEMVFVRGLPKEKAVPGLPGNISVYNHLPANELQQKILASEYLVSRSGYSTLMDGFTLQKKCIFIPTPGQTEQEYLGNLVTQKQMGLVYKQRAFVLEDALKEASGFHFHFPLNTLNNLLEIAVDNMLARITVQESPGTSFYPSSN